MSIKWRTYFKSGTQPNFLIHCEINFDCIVEEEIPRICLVVKWGKIDAWISNYLINVETITMALSRYLRNVKNFIRHDITLEPVIFGYLFTWFLVEGSQMTTNLLITKICQIELNYGEEFCKKVISKESMTLIEKEKEAIVQTRVNNFEVCLR